MKKLNQLFPNNIKYQVTGNLEISISGLSLDSRLVIENDLFFALNGTISNGSDFIEMAIQNGAVGIVCNALPENVNPEITYVVTENTNKLMGWIASAFYDFPSKKIDVIGVTGTNGKTTIVSLLFNLFSDLGYKCGLISTVQIQIHKEVIPATHTTPDALTLQKTIHKMAEEEIDFLFMEVSSHSVVQERISGIEFKVGIFTNLTHDHLDFHKTFENYRDAKKGFFDLLGSEAFVLSNYDDRNGKFMLQNSHATKYSYGLFNDADFKARIIEMDLYSMEFEINGKRLISQISGKFNALNLTAVYSTALLLDMDMEKVIIHISKLQNVEGRFNKVISPNKITAIIDYAHTPDALKNILEAIEEVNVAGKKVITVVGAGGNRDREKRPLMAKISMEHSHKLILTSDNPRNENPEDILNEMEKGIPQHRKMDYLRIADRKSAIQTAIQLASSGDIILIAGKGHEKYQEIDGVKHPFDDKLIVQEFFKNLKTL